MTNNDELLWVYQYIYWDEALRAHKTSKRYATREAILDGLGVIVHSSARKVRYSDLKNGVYESATLAS